MALKKGTQIHNEGPKAENNQAEVFRFIREGNKKDLDIAKGQVLTVGEDITAEEGQKLLDATTWSFKEVKDNG